jgi:hypothetical protein
VLGAKNSDADMSGAAPSKLAPLLAEWLDENATTGVDTPAANIAFGVAAAVTDGASVFAALAFGVAASAGAGWAGARRSGSVVAASPVEVAHAVANTPTASAAETIVFRAFMTVAPVVRCIRLFAVVIHGRAPGPDVHGERFPILLSATPNR